MGLAATLCNNGIILMSRKYKTVCKIWWNTEPKILNVNCGLEFWNCFRSFELWPILYSLSLCFTMGRTAGDFISTEHCGWYMWSLPSMVFPYTRGFLLANITQRGLFLSKQRHVSDLFIPVVDVFVLGFYLSSCCILLLTTHLIVICGQFQI